jgi:ribosomal subunit interface protein
MNIPLQLTFRHMPASEAIEAYVRAKADKLDRFGVRISRCHVVLDVPHRHQSHGRAYRVQVDLHLPGREIVVSRSSENDERKQDAYAAIDVAFDELERQVDDYVSKRKNPEVAAE